MSDDLLLYIVAATCFLLILRCFKYSGRFAWFNLAIFVIYSIVLYWQMLFHGSYGSAFLWWCYLAVATLVQLTVVSIYLIIKFFKG